MGEADTTGEGGESQSPFPGDHGSAGAPQSPGLPRSVECDTVGWLRGSSPSPGCTPLLRGLEGGRGVWCTG